MAGTAILYKGSSDGQVNPGGISVLTPGDYKGPVDIVDAKGNVILTLNRAPPGPPEGPPGPFGAKYYSRTPGSEIPVGSLVRIKNSDGSYSYAKAGGSGTYRGSIDAGEGSLENPAVIPQTSSGTSGVPGQFSPGQAGQFGAIPAYVGGLFPNAALANYNPITAAPYQFTDPMKYAEKFGAFNRQEIQKNFDESKDIALKELDTELSSLQHFVPAASALKRQETSLDNQFNQQQRTQQVDAALPGVRADLNNQADRARAYASGKIPDAVQNQAFEVGVRSAAADSAAAGGFGAASSVSRKASDLLSATQRIGLSKYGDQLLSGNINQKASLFLAPTEYSNAGTQINVNPSLSSSQLINSNLNAINGLTTISPGQGLASTTQQNQFTTGLQQQTNQFNASNQLQTSEFNAGAQNTFALDKFGYQAGFANSVAGGAQTDINTQFGLQQQQMYGQLLNQYQNSAQNAGLTSSLGLITGLLGGVSQLAGGGKGASSAGGGKAGGGGGLASGAGAVGEITSLGGLL